MAWRRFVDLAGCVVTAYACAMALGYVPLTTWWLHMLFWPSLVVIPVFALSALLALILPTGKSPE